jgi:hypothetical protein
MLRYFTKVSEMTVEDRAALALQQVEQQQRVSALMMHPMGRSRMIRRQQQMDWKAWMRRRSATVIML